MPCHKWQKWDTLEMGNNRFARHSWAEDLPGDASASFIKCRGRLNSNEIRHVEASCISSGLWTAKAVKLSLRSNSESSTEEWTVKEHKYPRAPMQA